MDRNDQPKEEPEEPADLPTMLRGAPLWQTVSIALTVGALGVLVIEYGSILMRPGVAENLGVELYRMAADIVIVWLITTRSRVKQ